MSELIILTSGMLGLCLTAPAAWGQLTARVEDFAVLPTGTRMSVMTADPNGRLFVNGQNGPLYTIDLLHQTTGNANLSRVDLRFSLGLPGEVFLLNKHDGVVRRLVAVPEPAGFVGFALAIAGWTGRRRRRNCPS
jgi:hypothetical protein